MYYWLYELFLSQLSIRFLHSEENKTKQYFKSFHVNLSYIIKLIPRFKSANFDGTDVGENGWSYRR